MIVIKYNQNEKCDARAHIKSVLRCAYAYEKEGFFAEANEKRYGIVMIQ